MGSLHVLQSLEASPDRLNDNQLKSVCQKATYLFASNHLSLPCMHQLLETSEVTLRLDPGISLLCIQSAEGELMDRLVISDVPCGTVWGNSPV